MASIEIPETVVGVPLFSPDHKNQFSVDAGGMPNGDDCLVIHGDVSQDYCAYMPAPALTPNLMLSRIAKFAISFWINAPAITHAAGARNDQMIMGVMTANKTSPDGTQKVSGFRANDVTYEPDMVWGIMSSGGGTDLTFFRVVNHFSYTTSVYTYYRASHGEVTLNPGWNFIVVNVGEGGLTNIAGGGYLATSEIYVNNVAGTVYHNVASGFDHEFTSTAVNANQKFCIGSYSEQANMGGRAGEYRLGKIAFHSDHLDATERTLLYNAMTA